MRIRIYEAMGLVMAAVALAGCSSEDLIADSSGSVSAETDNYPSDGVVRVASAEVIGVNNTKSGTNTTTRGVEESSDITQFSLWITNENDDKYSYSNVVFTGSNSDGWTPSETPYWESRFSTVGMKAIYPSTESEYVSYDSESETISVSVSTLQEPSDTEYDFLVWQDDDYTPSEDLEDGYVVVDFSHALSKLTFNIYLGDSFNGSSEEEDVEEDADDTDTSEESDETSSDEETDSSDGSDETSSDEDTDTSDESDETDTSGDEDSTEDEEEEEEDPLTDATYGVDTSSNPVTKVFIRGTSASGTCDLGGDLSVSGTSEKGSTDDIYVNSPKSYTDPESSTDNGIATFECILIPQEVDALSVRFTIGNYTYRWQADESITLEGGNNYEVNIVVGDNSTSWATVLGEETDDDTSTEDDSDEDDSSNAKGTKISHKEWNN